MRLISLKLVLAALLGAAPALAQTTPETRAAWQAANGMTDFQLVQACEDGTGDAAACTILGARFLSGEGVGQDYRKATDLLSYGCEAGYGWGCYDLAMMVERDILNGGADLAMQLHYRGCQMGAASSCFRFGNHALKPGRRLDFARDDIPRPAKVAAVQAYHRGCFGLDRFDPVNCRRFAEISAGAFRRIADDLIAIAQEYPETPRDAMNRACTDIGRSPLGPMICEMAFTLCEFTQEAAFCDRAIAEMAHACRQGERAYCVMLVNLSIPAIEGDRYPSGREIFFKAMHQPSSAGLRDALERFGDPGWTDAARLSCALPSDRDTCEIARAKCLLGERAFCTP